MSRKAMRVSLKFNWPIKQEWTRGRPPAKGKGWQMWETTSQYGSPISPVFETPEALARWLADTGASVFGGMTADYEGWLRLIHTGQEPYRFVMKVPHGWDPGAWIREKLKGEQKDP